MIQLPNEIDFPDVTDSVQGEWVPIFIEPVVGSGERIAIGIAAHNESGGIVLPMSALERLRCVYGNKVESILFAAEEAINSLAHALETGQTDSSAWELPFDGIYIGESRSANGRTLYEIAETAMMLTSSLIGAESALTLEESMAAKRAESITDERLAGQIRESVISEYPDFKPRFMNKFAALENGRKATYGYVGKRLAANFTLFTPKGINRRFERAKAKLWDLGQLKDHIQEDKFGLDSTITQFELMLYCAHKTNPEFTSQQISDSEEAVKELEAEADRKDIRCRPLYSVEEMAAVIVKAEAA